MRAKANRSGTQNISSTAAEPASSLILEFFLVSMAALPSVWRWPP